VSGLAALAVMAAARPMLAQIDPATEPVPGLEDAPYDYAALLRIPRSEAADLDALIRRHVTPRVERRGKPIAGPYRIVIEADGSEYVVRILTTEVPDEVRLRFDELGRPTRDRPTTAEAGSPDRSERDSRAP